MEWKKRERERYNEYMNDYMKNRYKLRRESVINRLGGCCNECGSIEKLELDHIDPKSKIDSIAKLSSISEVRFKEEIEKCQLLCKKCHLKKSRNEGSFGDRDRNTVCICGRSFTTIKSYAGHKRWCEA